MSFLLASAIACGLSSTIVEQEMVADMEVGKVADKVVDMVADMAFLVGGSNKKC